MVDTLVGPDGDRSPHPRPPSAPGAAALIAAVTALTAVAGGLAGAALWWVTDWLSNSDIGGPGWALRGNGALIVPVLGFPLLLVAGWGALALLARAGRRSPRWLLAPGLVLPPALVAGLVLANTAVPALASGRAMAREGHTATRLADGRVLVAGGSGAHGPLATAALYDPASGAWAPIASLAAARAGHTATLLADGRVLVAGAFDPRAAASAELYDPATGRWVATASMGSPRGGHAATALPDGRVLVTGGAAAAGVRVPAELYDPATGGWSPAGRMGVARTAHTATTLRGGRVLVSGGVGGGERGGGGTPAELYDPATGTWAPTGAPRGSPFQGGALLLPDGTVLVAGADGPSEGVAAEVYDPATGAWSPVDGLGRERYRFAIAALPDGRVLLAGGVAARGPQGRGKPAPASEVYDPRTGATTTTGALGTPRVGHTLTPLADGTVLAVGGVGRAGPLATAERFDPATGAWAPAGIMDARERRRAGARNGGLPWVGRG